MGFVLKPEDRDALVALDARNSERIFPYLGGAEVNSSPTQTHDRYVISFGQMELDEAERWPDLISIVREKVQPERDRLKDNPDGRRRKQFWWQFGRETPALSNALKEVSSCLVTSQVAKHLIFSRQQPSQIFSQRLYVFPFESWSPFGILQSRVHEVWAWLTAATLKSDLSYTASDCFETFPFPESDPRTEIPELEEIGKTLYEARAAYLVDTDQGLTQCYNRLKNPADHDERVAKLRRLHEEMDRAVLDAYGWHDVEVPPYVDPTTDEERLACERFEDDVIDRLFVLNAERDAEEQRLGLAADRARKKKGGKRPAAGKGSDEDQGKLF